jgi:signal transduction histidine kinase
LVLERTGEWQGELIHLTQDGRELVVESRHLLVSEPDGRRWVLESSRDVTDRQHAEQQRLRLEQEREEFLAAASHDLKSPLATIKASAQLLRRQILRDGVEPQRAAEMIATMESAASRMAEQIDAFADITRVRMGRAIDLEPRPTDLVDLVRHSTSIADPTSPELSQAPASAWPVCARSSSGTAAAWLCIRVRGTEARLSCDCPSRHQMLATSSG